MPVATNGNGNHSQEVILITGAGGWLGGVLAQVIRKDPVYTDAQLILADIVEPKPPKGVSEDDYVVIKADLSEKSGVESLFTTKLGPPSVIYCLHGIMSRGAEDNFDLGMKINIDSTRLVLEAARKHKAPNGQPAKFIFTSSIAVFGGPLPHEVMPETQASPEGSYGCGKLIAELEPLHGVEAICPIGDSFDDPALDELEAWVASPGNVIENFVFASKVDTSNFKKHSRTVNLPGFTVSIKQELEALKDVCGQETLDLVKYKKDPVNARIVGSWARAFNNKYSLSLGFVLHPGGFRQIVENFKADVAVMNDFAQQPPIPDTEYKELKMRLSGKFADDNWGELLPAKKDLPTAPQPTRKSSGIAVQALVPKYNSFVAGSADLMESTFVNFKGQVDFQNPETGLGDYTGRQIRFGIREHAMIGLSNGMAAYQKGMFIPICSTFFMFFLYAAPAVRMAVLQGLRFIGIATHDSIGIGEDGPTHQPLELANYFKSLPNFNLLRPADAEEVMGAWQLALADENANTPSLLCLSRQAVPLLDGSDRSKVAKGAYVVYGHDIEPELTIVATGTEVSRAITTAKILSSTKKVRVVSMPLQKHFDAQSFEYRQSVLPTSKSLVVSLEAWGSYGWARYAHASLSMHTFGYSAPADQLYEKFGFKPENMASKIDAWVQKWKAESRLPAVGEFEELLLGYAQH
ncbi:hypothetical protein QFC21_002720 [Naganishia friedmannii]|uniref:Uncharacterized protein n=1 Tax=Naganishia friedmannii TaxID=89922 RepID=A0ACC2VVD2_9TREE|nr:hypothetical protein QFC21_002720 [Naganishia friedmannii]